MTAEWRGLFEQAVRFHHQNKLGEAEDLYRQALAAAPDAAPVLHMLGVVRAQQGRNDEALELLNRALAGDQGDANAWMNRAQVLKELKRLDEAVADYDQALARNPRFAEAWYNRSLALAELGRIGAALESCDRALGLRPSYVEALFARGHALATLKRFAEALAAYDRAVALSPRFAEAYNNRGGVLVELQRAGEALASFERAMALKPDYADAMVNRAHALRALGRLAEALAGCEAALAIAPQSAAAHYESAAILRNMDRPEDALGAYARVLELQPGNPFAAGMAAEAALSICDWQSVAKYAAMLEAPGVIVSPLIALGLTGDPAILRRHAERYAASQLPKTLPRLSKAAPRRHDRIRLAYLSSDYGPHPVAQQIAQLIEKHDRAGFEVIGVALGAPNSSDIRARLIKAFDRFEDTHGKSDQAVAELLRRLEVDIAIDLNGYTRGGRRAIFALRPAPVQVNYLGYPGTIGDDTLDYVIGDDALLPKGQENFFSEKIVRLPGSFLPSDSSCAVATPPPRRDAGLPEHGFVFCAFHHPWKIGADFFDVWMRLLAAVPGSVLWLRQHGDAARERLQREADRRGIDPARLVFAGRTESMDEHLGRHRLADLFLDTLPYNGHATAADALWAGLPVLTCAGESFAGRVGASLLQAAGLPELVMSNLADYEALALALALAPARLAALKAKWQQNRSQAPLFDTAALARNLEAAYRQMREIAERAEAPHAFTVEQG